MSSLASTSELARGLWYAPHGHAEENDGSWLVRAASVYGVPPTEMYVHLRRFNYVTHLEDERKASAGEAITPAAFGVSASTSYCDLGSYCPICMARDLRVGEMPWFRREWHRVWSTHCPIDGTPLFRWPYWDDPGQLVMPPWVAQVHLGRRRTVRLSNENREFVLQLRLARKVRGWVAGGAASALPWLQQLEQEQMLLGQGTATYALAGLCPLTLRRVVTDTVTLLCDSFGASQRCHASYLAGFLGPSWLFAASFVSGRALAGYETRCLRSYLDPAQRRTLITLALRLLASFSTDPQFDRDALLVGVGETALSRTLNDSSLSASRWASRRAQHWPRLASLGIRDALRCDPASWPALDAA